jgi:hypothetical protein
MSYTLVRVVEAGVVLREGHRARFEGCSATVLAAFDAFCTEAAPGIYVLRAEGDALRVTVRERSAVRAGMPIGFAPSPYFGVGDFPKPAPPCPYDEVRIEGVCTFLTDDLGEEVIEACRGVALAFVDGAFVRAGSRFSRVTSVAEAFLAREGMRAQRLTSAFASPWAVANAVAGVVCVGPRGADAREAAEAARAWTAAMNAAASRSPRAP